MTQSRQAQRNELLERIYRNGQKRRRAEVALADARTELADLLAEGLAMPWPLKLAAMAREAGISRETAYRLLRARETEGGDS